MFSGTANTLIESAQFYIILWAMQLWEGRGTEIVSDQFLRCETVFA